jgi:hypothetical protein
VQADVLVLHHHAAGLQLAGHIEVLRQVERGRLQALAQVGLVAVRRERDAVHGADVHAGVALDAGALVEHRLHVAIEAALRFLEGGGGVEAQFHLDPDARQRLLRLRPRHPEPGVDEVSLSVAPLVDAHLLGHQVHGGSGRVRGSSPCSSLSIEIAASWPCATAVMMFFGP